MEIMPRRLAVLLAPALLVLGCKASHSARPEPAPPAPPPGDVGSSGGDRPHYDSFQLEDSKLVLPGPIVFASDTELDVGASNAALWYIHDYLEAKDYITLARLEGHGDVGGQDALMQTGDRALTVGRWLVEHGIDCKRLLAAAYGDSKPVADPSTADGRARNRRIEVVNAELRGRAIGGMPVDGSAPASAPVCD
jgi:outer membrane protein OmpA-like peptidoglycan-associated protein